MRRLILLLLLVVIVLLQACAPTPPQAPVPVPKPIPAPAPVPPLVSLPPISVPPPASPLPAPTTPMPSQPSPVPGRSQFTEARIKFDQSTELKAGETKSLGVNIETREDGPGLVTYRVVGAAKEYSEEELPIPQGLEVSIVPDRFAANPQNIYESKITIKASPGLAPGEYWLIFKAEFENVFQVKGWIKVTVVR